ncbi:hypothetical protein G4B88_029019 [Cannabis sativa]|uniref:CCHC-type domain-containing protein n=1 Tax=Cannabis sativa TaxID=3483 RepID=A0A7J6HNV7_CANSA|nr:hypothetical protein G4B88_029019 [Cannabis sativa]
MGTIRQRGASVRRGYGVPSPVRPCLLNPLRVLGFLIPFSSKGNSHLILLCYSCNSPCFEIVLCFCGGLVYPSFQSESMASAPSLNTNQSLQDNVEVIEEMVSLVENVSVDDFSLDLVPNDEVAKETISRSLVGKFFAKRKVGNGKLRSILSQMWNVSPGWSMQEIHPKIFIFRFSKESDALKVLEKGPWSPCGGFLLLTTMPSDGKWSFADLEHVNIWVRALGVPYRFFSDDNVIKIANRVGSFVLADKVRSNGVIRSNFLRFRVSLDLAKPLLAGVGLDDEDGKKVWSYFKYEWLPLVCYKCGVIGHEEDACSARKRMMVLDDGRSVPLFGPWLKVGSRLENGLAVLKAEDIQERIQMEQEDAPCDTNPKAASKSSVSVEGRVIHGGDNSFSIQGEEGTAKTTPNHISGDPLGARPFNVLESTLGFNNGGGKRKGPIGSNPTHRNSKVAKLTGPKGVAKKPIFGYNSVSAVEQVGNKRKKSQPQKECNLFQGDNSNLPHKPGTKDGILDVFAEISVAADATRAYPRDNLNGEEESLKFCEVSRPRKQKKSMGKSDSLLALEQDDGLFEVSVGISNDSKLLTNSALPTGEFMVELSGRDSNFWNASIPSSASWGAKGIFATRDLIRRESCWLVGNGQNVDIWSSPWVPWVAWDVYEAAFNNDTGFVNFDRSLNLGDLSIWFKPEFLEQLGRLSLLPPGSHDSLVWKSSLDGSFSVKSAYTAIIECRKGDLDVLFQQLWKTPFSERLNFLCGKWARTSFLVARGSMLCLNAEDSLEHLFFHCHMARYCWFKSSWGIRSDLLSFASTREILNWILNPPFGGSVDLPQFSLFAASLCYTLWNVRNKTFHDNLLATPESIFQTVMKSLRETRDWVAPSGSLQQPIVVPGLDRLWSGSLVNIFVDAAMRGTDAFLAILSLDDQGERLRPFRCISCNWSRVRIYSDCKVAVDAVLARKIPNWKLSSLFLQLFNLLDGFVSCKLCWISRLLNVAAHSLATRAASLNFCGLFSVTDVSAAMNSN